MNVVNQDTGAYLTDDDIIRMALTVLEHRFMGEKPAMNSPKAVRDYLNLSLSQREHEVFACVFMDCQNKVIALEELFRGSLTQTSVYPREVVKRALHHNAGAVIFAHNHPSGLAEPSRADEHITKQLEDALELVDVRVLDHFIVGGGTTFSFAERGMI